MKCLGFIFIALFHFNVLSSQYVEPPQVGVLDFEPRGIPTSLSQRFTEDFRNELEKANLAQVIDRGTLLSTLEDRGYERTNCTTDYCEALIGKLLDIKFIISGSIEYSDSLYTIDMNMVSVNTGSIEKSKTMVVGSNQNLKDDSETLAWNAFDLKSPQQIAAIEERERIAKIASTEEIVPVEIKAQFK